MAAQETTQKAKTSRHSTDQQNRFKEWRQKRQAVAKRRGKGSDDSRWFGRVATAEGGTERWKDNYYGQIHDDVVIEWVQQQRENYDDDDLGLSLLAQVLADEITKKLHGDQAARKELLRALPLTMRPALRRDRLRLGAVVPGTASRGTTLQRIPRYSWNTRPLIFLRGVLQLRRRLPAGSEVRKKLDEADKALRRIGVVSVMSEASLKLFDSAKDRMLKGSGLDDVRSWCEIGEWIVKKEILLGEETNERTYLLERVEWFVFLPSLFEARVRARLGALLGGQYVVKKDSKKLRLYERHKAEPDIVVYKNGKPIAIYEVKLYKSSKASINHMYQIESQIAAVFDDPQNCRHYGLIYGHFEGELPKWEAHVYHIDLRGGKGYAEDFDATLKELSVFREASV